jgi:CopG family nickel-responsive transcriptional regulator
LSAEGVARISISLPRDLLEEFDTVIESTGLDRSKAIQQSMRNYITEHRWAEDINSKVSGVIVMLLDHDTPGLEDELTDIQHNHLGLINSTTHVHLDERICLEALVVRGKTSEIRSLIEALGSKRVLQLRHMIVG